MGVSIQGINLEWISLDHKISNPASDNPFYEPYVIEGFERSLLEEEIIFYDDCGYDGDSYSETTLSTSCSSYNKVRNLFSLALVNKSDTAVFNECDTLEKNQPYPNPLYHIINFSDCEGFIGPAAVKEMAKFLKSKKGKELRKKVDSKSLAYDLVKIILETCEMENGYVRFS